MHFYPFIEKKASFFTAIVSVRDNFYLSPKYLGLYLDPLTHLPE